MSLLVVLLSSSLAEDADLQKTNPKDLVCKLHLLIQLIKRRFHVHYLNSLWHAKRFYKPLVF